MVVTVREGAEWDWQNSNREAINGRKRKRTARAVKQYLECRAGGKWADRMAAALR